MATSGIYAGLLCLFLSSTYSVGAATREAWPARPLRVVVPFVAGGGVDTVARITASRLGASLGQQVIVDNRPGARGVIGADLVAKAVPDGYTALVISESLTVMPFIERGLPFDVRRSFAPVSLLATQPLVLAVHPSVPAPSMKEFITLARTRPGALSYGSGGFGQHLAGEVIKKIAAFDMTHIPYKGGAQAVVDLVGGQLNAAVLGSSPVIPFARSGKLKVLVVTSKSRSSALPNVPTLSEAGFDTIDLSQWVFMVAPAKVPQELIVRLNSELAKTLTESDTKERFATAGFESAPNTPKQLDAMIAEALDRWSKLMPELHIKPE